MSFAIIKTGGKQYKVTEGDKVLVEKLDLEAGEEFDFEEVLLVVPVPKLPAVETKSQKDKGDKKTEDELGVNTVTIGQPFVSGAKVHAKVLEQGKAKKKIVFKYHSKTRYKKKKGHRQPFTKVEILKITTALSAPTQ